MLKIDTLERWINDMSMLSRRDVFTVFTDMMQMSAIAMSNMLHLQMKADNPDYQFPAEVVEREETYLATEKPYKEMGLNAKFGEFIGTLLLLMEQEPDDYLGALFMRLQLSSSMRGQFFTPIGLSEMMAAITLGTTTGNDAFVSDIKTKLYNSNDYVTLYDPAVGAGSTLIGAIRNILRTDPKLMSNIVCVGADVDIRCVHMAFTQLACIGVPAIISHQNTISLETWSTWYTHQYFSHAIPMRRLIRENREKSVFGRRGTVSTVRLAVHDYFKRS